MDKIERIRQLNDNLRTSFKNGTVLLSRGVRAKSPLELCDILEGVKNFNDFSKSNDPTGEHDFGSFKCHGNTIFFKIDYYNNDDTYLSPDPSNPNHTHRVLTILLADEY